MESATQEEREAVAEAAQASDLSPEAHQFDFWLGEWDVTWEGGSGTNSVTRILDDRVIRERFTGFPASPNNQPFHGLSLSVYDSDPGRWRQTWVDNSGAYIDFTGGYADGKLTLATERPVDDKSITRRMVFYNITADALAWDWERSEDGGQSWRLLWRIHYQRRA
jgi:hypothetical protein